MKRRSKIVSLLFALLVAGASANLLAMSSAVSEESIVVNGGFEIPVVDGPWEAFGPPGFEGWTIDSGTVDIVNQLWIAAKEEQSLDLNGYCCEPGSISQVLSTSPGSSYLLRFQFAGNPDPDPICPGTSPRVKEMEVLWDGDSLGIFTFDIEGRSLEDPGWTQLTLPVSAVSSASTVSFRSLIRGACGPALDDVSLTPATMEASRRGRGCGDKNHVHEDEIKCKKDPK